MSKLINFVESSLYNIYSLCIRWRLTELQTVTSSNFLAISVFTVHIYRVSLYTVDYIVEQVIADLDVREIK